MCMTLVAWGENSNSGTSFHSLSIGRYIPDVLRLCRDSVSECASSLSAFNTKEMDQVVFEGHSSYNSL